MSDSFTSFGFDWNPYANAANSFWNQRKDPVGSECGADVTLRLDSPYYNPKWSQFVGAKRKRGEHNGTERIPEHASLSLGLGHSSSSSDFSKGSSATACTITSVRESTDEESSADLGFNFQLHLGNDNACSLKKRSTDDPKATEIKPIFDLQLSLSTGLSESSLINSVKIADEEGSASSELNLHSYLLPSSKTSECASSFPVDPNSCYHLLATVPDLSPNTQPVLKSPVTCTSGTTHSSQRTTSNKNCQFQGCAKGARGASGLCIAHGGGRRCQKFGCHKGAEGKTVYCKAHGGGRRCQYLGCTKSAEGRTDYCIAHGGGRRCKNEDCTRAARGKSGLCIRHGGGKRCQRENCTKSAEGFSGLCISHGGGRRCQFPSCTKGAQGSTMFCKAHGGGKRCTILGCTKGAEGSTPFCKGHGGGKRCSFQGGLCSKSVHGGTQFCVAHGGGKRCAFPDCTKSARGRTDYCVRHGGGKRCKSEGCGKSAQGSTDFCKAHGGGKRCSWGQPGSDYGASGPPCDRFARGKVGLCGIHGALVQDSCIHGGGTMQPPLLRQPISETPEVIKEADSEHVKTSRTRSNYEGFVTFSSMNSHQPKLATLPEGRVHGGRLMAMLSSYPHTGKPSSSREMVASAELSTPYAILHEWI
ncbi:hypothetical protein M5K25_022553 [Dendrobium thyrsiflorum]|uniref:WRKY19-like zinc finger domain-containing protein n=1 Tax=Dendrobium thyrsiflorum TaxID=117978 RepID=A0ABD0UD03_DENTH